MNSPTQFLIDALSEELPEDREDTSLNRESYRLDMNAVVRSFKNKWIYSSKISMNFAPDEASGSYLFLFYKNLHVTNIMLPELISLIRINTGRRNDQQPHEVNFFSDEEYTHYLVNVLGSLYPTTPIYDKKDFLAVAKKIADVVAERHSTFLNDTIILNAYFTTALMHIPLSLSTNIQNVVFQSGYIHSAGHALYIRKVEKAKQDEIEQRIRAFLDSKHVTPPIYITPYADEYFSPYEKQYSVTSTRNGLDGIRIELRKHYVNLQPLSDFLNSLDSKIDTLRVAPGLTNYKAERRNSGANSDWTIWFISDTRHVTTEDDSHTRSREHYLIVYAQYYHNGNQFILFKERKPAWTAPITLPHTLSISMINLFRYNLKRTKAHKPIIVDPFCGTGTTLIDAATRIPDAVIIGLDKNLLMPRLVRDNLEFFSSDLKVIKQLRSSLNTLCGRLEQIHKGIPDATIGSVQDIVQMSAQFDPVSLAKSPDDPDAEFQTALIACLHELRLAAENAPVFLDIGSQRLIDEGFSKKTTDVLLGDEMSLRARVMFFVTWRAIANARHVLRDQTQNLFPVLQREYTEFVRELGDYEESLGTQERESFGAFSCRRGTYSRTSIVGPQKLSEIPRRNVATEDLGLVLDKLDGGTIYTGVTRDSVTTLCSMEKMVDVIVTDPPYGFNTREHGMIQLQAFYNDFIKSAVAALKPRGQLVVAVPSYARNGKQVPFFQTQGALTRQIIASANELNRDVLNVIHTVPEKKSMYLPPFYWSSPSALSRKILWFTIG